MPRVLLAAGFFAATVLAAPFQGAALAQTVATRSPAQPGLITVTGEGVAKKAPDMAVITLTVLREGETARAALDANNSAMGSVLSAMEADGIAEKDLQTSGFSIQPRYSAPAPEKKPPQAPQIVGYQVSNTLSVRIHDLTKVGDILDQSVSLGVNQGGNILFTNEDPSQAMSEARKSAMADAIAKAKALTDAAGVGLGAISRISEQTSEPHPMPMMRAAFKAGDQAGVPIAAGSSEFRASVTVTWEISQ